MTNITARGFKLRDDVREKVSIELERIEKMLPQNVDYQVTISLNQDMFKCDITVKHLKTYIRGEAKSSNVLSAIDFAVDDLKRKVRKLKTKLIQKHTGFEYEKIMNEFNGIDIENDCDGFEIVRTKKIFPKTMSDEEAILQMELLGHSFFIYNDEAGNVSVTYKRKDGGYGKIVIN